MATHSSILDWKNLIDRRTWWATVHEVSKSQTCSATKQKHNCIYSGSLNNGFEQSRSTYMCIFFSINIYSALLICGFCIHRLNQTIRIFICDPINRWCETHRVGRLTAFGVFSIHRFWYPPWLLEPIPQKYQGTNCMCTYNAGIKTL